MSGGGEAVSLLGCVVVIEARWTVVMKAKWMVVMKAKWHDDRVLHHRGDVSIIMSQGLPSPVACATRNFSGPGFFL